MRAAAQAADHGRRRGLAVVRLLEAASRRSTTAARGPRYERLRPQPPFSRIADDVGLGEGVVIHSHVNLYGCTIGDESRIGTFVEIQRNAIVGRRCKISSHTFICEGVKIDDECFIGHHVVFVNDRYPAAVTSDGTPQGADDWRLIETKVRRRSSIGSGAVILCGVTIGEGALVGAGSVVTKDVEPYTVVAGNPARQLRKIDPARPRRWRTDDTADHRVRPHVQPGGADQLGARAVQAVLEDGMIDELIAVDDGSTDGTPALLAACDYCTVITHPAHRGIGNAIRSAYRHALEGGYDVFVIMAGNGKDDPAQIPIVLAPVLNRQGRLRPGLTIREGRRQRRAAGSPQPRDPRLHV